MVAAACLTMAGVHWLVWYKQRTEWSNLLFAVTAMATSIFVGTELWIMRAETPAEIGTAVRWAHIPIWLVLIALVGFVRLYLRAGRVWLLWCFIGLRTLSLLLNFITGQNLNYEDIVGVSRIPFLGESVSVVVGTPNPWMLVGQLSSLVLILFAADASLTVWRRGEHRKAVLVGGSVVFFVVGGQLQSMMVFWGMVQMPIMVSLFYLGIVMAMGYELSHDVLRAAQLGRELRESEQRMELAASAAELGMWTWDIARDEIWATDEARALFGFTKSERIDSDRFLGIPSDHDELATKILAKSMNGNGEYENEQPVVLSDGQVRWIASRGRVEFNSDGTPNRLRGVSVDISKRKQVEEARNNLAAIVESSDDAIFSETPEGTITTWNAGAERMYGYRAAEITGQHVSCLAPLDLKEEVAEIITATSQGKVVDHRETSRVTKDGRRFDVSLTISPIKDQHGTIIGASTIARDITARKRAEREALQQRNELAHLSRVTMLGELSGSMAHELNQPLTAILSNAQAAQRFLSHEVVDLEEVREILTDIVDQDKRAGEVIRRLRLLLRKGEVQQQPLDVNNVVSEVLKLIRSDLVNQGITAHTELGRDLPPVYADRVQLQQVLLNLMINACDAMNLNHAADCEMVVRTKLANGEGVCFSVSDRGTGIASEELEHVFEPFFTTKTHGLGLGLSVCRTIIEAHQGRLWATNNHDKGATFHFTLPVKKGATV
jgi:PAS domain S-box-containing protein